MALTFGEHAARGHGSERIDEAVAHARRHDELDVALLDLGDDVVLLGPRGQRGLGHGLTERNRAQADQLARI